MAGSRETVSGMTESVLRSSRPMVDGDHARVRTTQRWAVGVLALSTLVLLAYVASLLAAAWLAVSVVAAVTGRPAPPVDLPAVVAAVAPGMLVGWCTGLATSAALARGEALGARASGVASGVVGTLAGAAVLALGGLV